MTDLFYTGGPLFMGILTIILIATVTVAIINYLRLNKGLSTHITIVKEIGIFGLIFGIFGQTLGLYSAFSILEKTGTVSPELLFSGLKVSSITTIYGLVICLIGFVLYLGLRYMDGQDTDS